MVLKLINFNSINAIFMLKSGVSQKFNFFFRNFQISDFSLNSMKKENHTKQTKLQGIFTLRLLWFSTYLRTYYGNLMNQYWKSMTLGSGSESALKVEFTLRRFWDSFQTLNFIWGNAAQKI